MLPSINTWIYKYCLGIQELKSEKDDLIDVNPLKCVSHAIYMKTSATEKEVNRKNKSKLFNRPFYIVLLQPETNEITLSHSILFNDHHW